MTLPAAASLSSSSASRFEYHNMAQIQRVAIIGGGSSGLIAATKLIDAGISVTIFEKYSEVGQAWSKTARYDPEVEAPRPPSEAAFVPIARGRQGSRTFVSEEFDFSGSSTSRTDTRDILASSIGLPGLPLPSYTPTFVPRATVSSYIKSFANRFNLHPYIQLNTRVELVEKVRGAKGKEGWRVRLRHVEQVNSASRETLWDEFFDAVVVATGNQQAPFVPCFPGVSPLPALYHSSDYTPPASYSDVAIMIVGSGQSALETAHKLSPFVRKIWIAARRIEGPDTHQASRRLQRFVLPSNAEAVKMVEAFEGYGEVRLVDGRLLSGIIEVVFATGYQYSFPFLPQYHSDPTSTPKQPSSVAPLATDGSSVQHLHLNTFYIPDPTLAILASSPTSTTATAEIQAEAIARVWTKRAALPTQSTMWAAYVSSLEDRGLKWLNWTEEKTFVRALVDWLDTHAIIAGVQGVDVEESRSEREKAEEVFVGRFGLSKGQFKEIWEDSEEKGSARDEMARKVRTAMMRRNGA